MENYTKGKLVNEELQREKIPIPNLPADFVWMKVNAGSRMNRLIEIAAKGLEDGSDVVWSAVGPGTHKAISCVEILKRKFKLHQITNICYVTREEHWDPSVPDLEPIVVTRDIPAIHILVSRNQLDDTVPGYQAPGNVKAFWKSTDPTCQNGTSKRLPGNRKQDKRLKHAEGSKSTPGQVSADDTAGNNR